MSYALNSNDIPFFIHDLEAEIRSIYLIRDTLKLNVILNELTELEIKLIKHNKKTVLPILIGLKRKFPYVAAS